MSLSLSTPKKASAFTYELSGSYSRQFISTQFDAVENWREASFIYTPTQSLSVPMYVSFTCADNYGEELEKWVSIYDSNNRLCYDSGWTSNINLQSVRSPFIGGSTSMHVYLRVRYRGGEIPLTPNMFQGGTFILDVTRRETETLPESWYSENTFPATSSIENFPTFTTSTVTTPNIPYVVSQNVSFMGAFFTTFLGDTGLYWLIVICVLISLAAWLLH